MRAVGTCRNVGNSGRQESYALFPHTFASWERRPAGGLVYKKKSEKNMARPPETIEIELSDFLHRLFRSVSWSQLEPRFVSK